MKYIKIFEEFKFKSISTDTAISKDIQQDIEDICLEFDDLKIDYCRSLGFKCEFNWEKSYLHIFSIRENGTHVDYPVESILEITDRIQRYIKIRNYKCKIFYDDISKHYYDEEWHEITSSTIIVFYKDKIKVKY